MHSLIEPDVLKTSGVAAVMTTALCYPNMALRLSSPEQIWLFCFVMLWAAFFLWSFVFAWHEQYSKRDLLSIPFQPKLWGKVTLTAGICAAIMVLLLDPVVRRWSPHDYPSDLKHWVAMGTFSLVFDQLFLCFAPFAVFIRLFQKVRVAAVLTVLFNLLVLYLKISESHIAPPGTLIASLLIFRVVGTSLTVYFYLEGGLALVWWWALLLQCRLLIGLG